MGASDLACAVEAIDVGVSGATDSGNGPDVGVRARVVAAMKAMERGIRLWQRDNLTRAPASVLIPILPRFRGARLELWSSVWLLVRRWRLTFSSRHRVSRSQLAR